MIVPAGTIGVARSVQPSSDNSLFPLTELCRAHIKTQFSQEVAPSRDRGTIWSTVVPRSGQPETWHWRRSRIERAALENRGGRTRRIPANETIRISRTTCGSGNSAPPDERTTRLPSCSTISARPVTINVTARFHDTTVNGSYEAFNSSTDMCAHPSLLLSRQGIRRAQITPVLLIGRPALHLNL